MPLKDLREFIDKLEQAGEAIRIEEEVDWHLEAGAMIRHSDEARLPAPLFQKVKGYPNGYRLFGDVLGSQRRIAIAMDIDPDSPTKYIIDEYLRRKKNPIKPVVVDDGPCKENVFVGDDVDLLRLPVPMVHEGDGGRFIGTSHITIAKDSTSEWVNWGMYRHMLQNKNTISLQAAPFTHVMRVLTRNWDATNQSSEIAIAIGPEPISMMCAASPIPTGVSEVDIVGGVRGEPLELVTCETVELLVPATAEIVIEGEVSRGDLMEEGPFGEFTGYMGGHRELRPAIRVKAVTYRNDPILTVGNEGMPVTNTHAIASITWAAEFFELLRAHGYPVAAVAEPVEGVQMLAVVAIKADSCRADEVAHAIWGSRAGASTPYIIVVEDDVDPFDLGEVVHAIISKCHPSRGIVKADHCTGMALIPWLSRHEQKHLIGARAYFDCTWPRDWPSDEVPRKCSLKNIYPPEIQQKALDKWGKYGY
jgi:4-hydroxy-3-polyprenylbenzoate decarboxylase